MGSFQGHGQMGTIDSAGWIFGSILEQLNKFEGALALIGLCYITKLVITHGWKIIKAARLYAYEPMFGCKQDWVQDYGRWAVVTGATDGIGKEYAIQLASKGMNILLLSRSIEKLNKVANEISTEYGVETKVIAVDFSDDLKIYNKIAIELDKIEVGLLAQNGYGSFWFLTDDMFFYFNDGPFSLNNVGVFPVHPMYLTEMDTSVLWQHVTVNVGAVTLMTRLVLPQMAQRRKGGIINISSSASLVPIPLITTYSATKVYVNYFSDGIRREYSKYGIIVQSLQPVYIATNMTNYSEWIRNSSFFVPSPRQYVSRALCTFGKSDTVAGYFPHELQTYVGNMAPVSRNMFISLCHRWHSVLRKEAVKQKSE